MVACQWIFSRNFFSVQKYRLYLSRLQNENELKYSKGMKHQDFPSRAASLDFQTSTLMHQKDAANRILEHPGNNMALIDMGTRVGHEADKKATVSTLHMDLKETSTGNMLDCQVANVSSQNILSSPFNYQSSQSDTTTQKWNELPMEQFKHLAKQEPEPYALPEDDFSHALQSASQNLIQADVQCSVNAVGLGTSVPERDKPGQSGSNYSEILDPDTSDAVSHFKVGMQNQMVELNCSNDWGPVQQNIFAVGGSSPGYEMGCSDTHSAGVEDIDYNPQLIDESETYYYDYLGFNCDVDCYSVQNPLLEQGFFTAKAKASGVCYPG